MIVRDRRALAPHLPAPYTSSPGLLSRTFVVATRETHPSDACTQLIPVLQATCTLVPMSASEPRRTRVQSRQRLPPQVFRVLRRFHLEFLAEHSENQTEAWNHIQERAIDLVNFSNPFEVSEPLILTFVLSGQSKRAT